MQSRVLAILIAVVLALVATTALVVYVNGADRRAISGQSPVEVWVATQLIKAGTSGRDASNNGLIARRTVPKASTSSETIRSLNQVADRFAAVDIVQGEVLLKRRWVGSEDVAGRRLLQIPVGHQAISVELDLARQVAGFVTPGDSVSVFLSMKRKPKGEEAIERTQYLLQNVRVLAVGDTALANANAQGGGGRVNQGRSTQTLTAVTLAVKSGADAERVVFAAEFGSIYLSLLPPNATPAPPTEGIDAGNVAGGR